MSASTKTPLFRLIKKNAERLLRLDAIADRLSELTSQEQRLDPSRWSQGDALTAIEREQAALKNEQIKLKRTCDQKDYPALCAFSRDEAIDESIWNQTVSDVAKALNAPVVGDYFLKAYF